MKGSCHVYVLSDLHLLYFLEEYLNKFKERRAVSQPLYCRFDLEWLIKGWTTLIFFKVYANKGDFMNL